MALPEPVDIGSLGRIIRALQDNLKSSARQGADEQTALDSQFIGIGEESGEALGAYRRWRGFARRAGTSQEVYDELADVLIVTMVAILHFAEVEAGAGPPEWIEGVLSRKLEKIFSRGWVNKDAETVLHTSVGDTRADSDIRSITTYPTPEGGKPTLTDYAPGGRYYRAPGNVGPIDRIADDGPNYPTQLCKIDTLHSEHDWLPSGEVPGPGPGYRWCPGFIPHPLEHAPAQDLRDDISDAQSDWPHHTPAPADLATPALDLAAKALSDYAADRWSQRNALHPVASMAPEHNPDGVYLKDNVGGWKYLGDRETVDWAALEPPYTVVLGRNITNPFPAEDRRPH